MNRRGFSRVFWLVIVAIIAVPITLENALVQFRSLKQTTQAAKESAKPRTWNHREYPRIGMAIDLPCPEDRFGEKIDEPVRKRISYYQEYKGHDHSFAFAFGRAGIRNLKEFSPDNYYDALYDRLQAVKGVTNFRVISGGTIDWKGCPAYLMTCTFDAGRYATRLHHVVRVSGKDILFVQAMFPLADATEGEKGWLRLLSSTSIAPMPTAH